MIKEFVDAIKKDFLPEIFEIAATILPSIIASSAVFCVFLFVVKFFSGGQPLWSLFLIGCFIAASALGVFFIFMMLKDLWLMIFYVVQNKMLAKQSQKTSEKI